MAAPTRPAWPGCPIGRIGGSSGTLGCMVVPANGEPGARYFLTAGHVLVGAGAREGDVVLQPGSDLEGNASCCTFGVLERWIPLDPSPGFTNVADAALIRLTDPASGSPDIPRIGTPIGRTDALELGTPVQLYGRTSGYTRGFVASLFRDIALTLPFPDGQARRVGFRDVVLCTRYSAGGDSGAAVLDMNGRVVGIHLGSARSYSFFSPIGAVCEALGLEVAGA